MSKIVDLLTRTRQFINADNWTQDGNFATDKDGVGVLALDPTACHFCTMGAMRRVRERMGNIDYLTLVNAENFISKAIVETSSAKNWSDFNVIAVYNDDVAKSIDDIYTVLDLAIEKAKENVNV